MKLRIICKPTMLLHISGLLLMTAILSYINYALTESLEPPEPAPALPPFDIVEPETTTEPLKIFKQSKQLLEGTGKIHHRRKHFFNYHGGIGQRRWQAPYPVCGGRKQSPINIVLEGLTTAKYNNLKWSETYKEVPSRMIATNNGHTVALKSTYTDASVPTIGGGPLFAKKYKFQELHFHWGTNDHAGSEHTIDSKTFPMELHVVHFREDLDENRVMAVPDGISVVGYLFEISPTDNPGLDAILEVRDMVAKNVNVPILLQNTFTLDTLALPFETEFVTYNGSLTTPPCTESVIWILSPYTLEVSEKQLKKFREIAQANPIMIDNYRDPQPLNGREVLFVS